MDQLFQFNQFEEQDLAALINSQGSVAITDLVLEEIKRLCNEKV